jgi:hypothetical protein
MNWERKLSFPIKLKDGRWLRTCQDVGKVIIALPESRQRSECWEATAKRLMDVADGRGDRSDLHLYLTQSLRADNLLAPQRPTRRRSEIRV